MRRLGQFEIEKEIGRGGNGIVLQAKDLQLSRRVALKIPHLAAALSDEAKARFEREAKAAASLNHPGIVGIHEVRHEQGMDFIVSQFVKGVNLASWADQHVVTPRQAAACVAFLADAMQHAHQRGVLHRDLKPSNVIVEESSDPDSDLARRCRIVDFGLAVIKTEVADDLTTSGAMIGTPAYMSPEQTFGRSDLIGPATDVYGLGVILYQLLTGQPPFAGKDLIQVVEKVRNEAPQSPQKLKPTIPVDLAAITGKCLEKRTRDRYPSAAALRNDLERFLNNETVLARPASALNRLGKWIQRNPAVTALIGTLMVAVAITSYTAMRTSAAEKKSRRSEEVARIEAGVAIEVSKFLEDMFQIPKFLESRQNQLRGKDVTAEQILNHAATKIQDDLNSQPQVQARLMTIIGSSLTDIGSFEAAEKLLRDGLALNLQYLEGDDPGLAKSHQQLGRLLRKLDKREEAEKQLRLAIAILEENPSGHPRQLANCYNDLGILLRPVDIMAARDAYGTARELTERYLSNEAEDWALSANIASLDYLMGRYEQSAEAFEQALESAIQEYGAEHPKVAMLQGNISRVYLKLGQYDKAKEYRLRDLAISEKELGLDHPETGIALLGLIPIHQLLGELEAAFEKGERAINILKSSLPPNHTHILTAVNNHVITLMRMERFDRALQLAKEIEEMDAQRVGKAADLQMLTNQIMQAQLERMAGHFDAAMSRIDSVIDHPLIETNKAMGTDVRFAKALLLAAIEDESAATFLSESLRFADAAGVIAAPDRAYLEAQFWALANHRGKAISKLREAIAAGYNDARILTDPDLHDLREMQAFQQILRQFQQETRAN